MGFLPIIVVMAKALELLRQDSFVPCTREGVQCRDCHTVGNCIPDGENGFTYDNDTFDICPGDVVCDEKTWFCERKGFCRYKKFECPPNDYEEEVLFPDPYSCIEFHGCHGSNQYDYACEKGTAFNAEMRDCSLKIGDRLCNDYIVPLCESSDQSGHISGTHFAYECVEDTGPPRILYPQIFLTTTTPATTDSSSDATATAPFETTRNEGSSSSPELESTTAVTEPAASTTGESTTTTEEQTTSTTGEPTTTTEKVTTTTTTETPTTTTKKPTTTTTETPTTTTKKPTTTTTETPTTTTKKPTTTTTETPTTTTKKPTTTTTETPTTTTKKPTTTTTETPTTTTKKPTTTTTETPTTTTKKPTTTTTETPTTTTKKPTTTTTETPTTTTKKPTTTTTETPTTTTKKPTTTTTETPTTTTKKPTTTTTETPTTTTKKPTTTTTETPTTTTKKPTTTTTEKPTITTTSLEPTTTSRPSFICPGQGYFSDPYNCYMYYVCYGEGLNFKHLLCRPGSHFDPVKSQCVRGSCSGPTPPTPTTSPPDFHCASEGYFPDEDCHCYIKCYSIDQNKFLHEKLCCRKGGYFDKLKRVCVTGSC